MIACRADQDAESGEDARGQVAGPVCPRLRALRPSLCHLLTGLVQIPAILEFEVLVEVIRAKQRKLHRLRAVRCSRRARLASSLSSPSRREAWEPLTALSNSDSSSGLSSSGSNALRGSRVTRLRPSVSTITCPRC